MSFKLHDTAHRSKQKQVVVIENGALYLVTEDDRATDQDARATEATR